MFYTVKVPWIFKKIRPSLVWKMPVEGKKIYLTFDDGPHPTATPFVLDQLKRFNAKATFFCIGKNVVENNAIYARILNEGHQVGNHTFNHLNGWKTNNTQYINNVLEAAKYIDSNLFRPPYGRISAFQSKLLMQADNAHPFKIIMWSVLSGDFDTKLAPENCLKNIILHTKPGDIIVFHDSAKAWERLSFALPRFLKYFTDHQYEFCLL
ncbi:polysaccharide deacetylase family protein [Limnovirga soli]|uniref:Polysaccharide deacetylase family protein n=1 Tax=Limnovirga soli TaxID=2656915 RepID=A0A8J8FDI8_9BACT|nr:polysaccharide deacetylase family protein [Limnovirga soli]NNV56051.1 polysaccharide deacetylase family protein [Limnovirga soli]